MKWTKNIRQLSQLMAKKFGGNEFLIALFFSTPFHMYPKFKNLVGYCCF
jgi:hypothetical protein